MNHRIALSLKPDFTEGRWGWSLAGEGFSATGDVRARSREDAVLCVLAEAHAALRTYGPVALVVSLPDTARLWSYAADVAAYFAGVTLVPFTEADTALREEAMRGLDGTTTPTPVVEDLGPLVVATDGSASHGRIGWGWLADSGQHACGTARPSTQECARRGLPPLAELRAISEAIAALPGRDLTILSDCQPALAFIREWMGGGDRVPSGYDVTHHNATRQGGLFWMQQQVRREAHRIDLGWVRGHTGDPLNEGADSLAKLARRAVEGTWGYTAEDVPARARAIADVFAAHHHPVAPAA